MNSDTGVSYKSDHSPVYLTFQFIKQDLGRETWKLNNTLLSDPDYVSVVKNIIEEVVSQYRVNSEDDGGKYFSINDQLLWETMKVMIRGKTISYSSYKNKEKNKSESDLEKQLSELYANNGNETEIRDIESKLTQLREKQIKGIMTRVEGERCSRYFCNLEKRNFVEKTIPYLILDDML